MINEMLQYPIQIPLKQYNGNNETTKIRYREDNELARKIMKYINDEVSLSTEKYNTFSYRSIAQELGVMETTVKKIIRRIAFQQTEITVIKDVD
tara:strand:- start:3651 stop:3932 length:282 start_codon:yes stop_codon:yes gene_type:complete